MAAYIIGQDEISQLAMITGTNVQKAEKYYLGGLKSHAKRAEALVDLSISISLHVVKKVIYTNIDVLSFQQFIFLYFESGV